MRRSPRTTLVVAALSMLLASAVDARAQAALRFVDPTPGADSVATTPIIAVQLDAACTVDPATLAVRFNGSSLNAASFLPFGPCDGGRMASQPSMVPLTRPGTTITQGRRRATVGDSIAFTATAAGGEAILWNFDGAGAPQQGATASATFRAPGKFKVRARATRAQTLEANASDGGTPVAALRTFSAGDGTPAKRTVRVTMPTEVDFANYEPGLVHPIAYDAAARRLYAVNTPEGRLSIFDVDLAGALSFAGDVPVGLDPVSLAVRPGTSEVWVVNHLSDSISVVDAVKQKLVATLHPGDEPTDVVFAGNRAFVTLAGKEDRVVVYRAAGRRVIASIDLFGDDPRALAVSPSGDEVYAVVLESGNRTTTLFETIVTASGGLPPPSLPRAPALGPAPATGLIVQQDLLTGAWHDEAGNDWSAEVDYTLPDHDVFVIDADASTPSVVRTVRGVGTTLYDVAVHPSGELWIPNTDARNLIRFEPRLRGHTIATRITRADPASATVTDVVDLNPHVDFGVTPGPAEEIAASLSQPTGGVFDAAGTTYYVAALGSAKVGVLSASGEVQRRIAVGGGPSGLALNEASWRLYVLNRFDNTISIVDTLHGIEVERTGVAGPARFDPSPDAIRKGRRFLYDATLSGHGDSACATCHLFGNFDNLAWDLGDPQGEFVPYANTPWVDFALFLGPSQTGFDPQKGPMTTQTLRGLAGGEPFHWRGDRRDFGQFDEAFVAILGAAEPPPAADMEVFTEFASTLRLPPNPFRNADDSLPAAIPVPAYDGTTTTGNPRAGATLFDFPIDAGVFTCRDCHSLPNGASSLLFNGGLELETQDFKIPHLRNMYEKSAYAVFRPGGQSGLPENSAATEQKKGYGALHDGAVSLKEFLAADIFIMTPSEENDMFAFMLAFPTESFPCVGRQVTLTFKTRNDATLLTSIATLRAQAQLGRCELIVKGSHGGVARGWLFEPATTTLRPDHPDEPAIAEAALRQSLAAGDVLTYTGVPPGSGRRLGIDRDRDGFLDRAETVAGSDPADPRSNAWSWSH